MWQNWNSYIAGENANGTLTLEKNVWKYLMKIVTHFSYDQALPLNRNKIIFSHKEVDVDVHYNITYYCCKLEKNKRFSTDEWVSKGLFLQ